MTCSWGDVFHSEDCVGRSLVEWLPSPWTAQAARDGGRRPAAWIQQDRSRFLEKHSCRGKVRNQVNRCEYHGSCAMMRDMMCYMNWNLDRNCYHVKAPQTDGWRARQWPHGSSNFILLMTGWRAARDCHLKFEKAGRCLTVSGNLETIEKAKASDHVDLEKKSASSDFHISMWHRVVSKGQTQGRVHDRRDRMIQDPTDTARWAQAAHHSKHGERWQWRPTEMIYEIIIKHTRAHTHTRISIYDADTDYI